MAAILARRAEGAQDAQQLALTAGVLQVEIIRLAFFFAKNKRHKITTCWYIDQKVSIENCRPMQTSALCGIYVERWYWLWPSPWSTRRRTRRVQWTRRMDLSVMHCSEKRWLQTYPWMHGSCKDHSGWPDSDLSDLLPQVLWRLAPQSLGSWSHGKVYETLRRTFPSIPISCRPDWERELALTAKFLSMDERNFHCWDYRSSKILPTNFNVIT